jgi:hypothetical protein
MLLGAKKKHTMIYLQTNHWAMKIFTNILLLLVLLFITHSLYSQETLNLDDYILDTIIQRSEIDTSIVDTLIIARRKVVVKKEVVVENKIFVAPVFNDVLLSMFASPVWSFNSPLAFQNQNVRYKNTPSLGFETGLGIQTSIKKKIETALELSYSRHNELFDYTDYSYTPSQKDSLITDTLEIFFIDNQPQYITESYLLTLRDTIADSLQTKTDNKYHSISIAFSVGKKIIFQHFQLCPKLSAAYQYTFLQKGYTTNSSYSLLNLDDRNNNHNLKIGLKIDMIVPIKKHFGIQLSPQIHFFSKKRNALYSTVDGDFGVSFGVFYKII